LNLKLDINVLSKVKETNFTWFHYIRRQTKLIGRESELKILQEFYGSDQSMFQWWVIEGAGGMGKSRLSLESALDLAFYWNAGFISKDPLATFDFRTRRQ